MRVLFFCRKMPDLCGAFFHDIDLAIELQNRGHQVAFLTILVPAEGYNGGTYRGFRYMHYTAASGALESADILVTPHSPILPDVRKINSRGYNRPIIATCHFDGNYTAISNNSVGAGWTEMLFFVNTVMEANYRKHILPWPSQIRRTEVIRPILHREKIAIEGEFQGNCITLINANMNKGVHQFLGLARAMPTHKFLGVLPYYGERTVPPAPDNVIWIPFDNDIRTILRRTRILLVPSYYESFGRVAVEAMTNGIPVVYAKPAINSVYPGGSTEGLQDWIEPAGIGLPRDATEEWATAIRSLDDPDVYEARSEQSKTHIESMNLFTEATRIAELVESFSRQHPVVAKRQSESTLQQRGSSVPMMPREPLRPVGFGFSNGRLKIQR